MMSVIRDGDRNNRTKAELAGADSGQTGAPAAAGKVKSCAGRLLECLAEQMKVLLIAAVLGGVLGYCCSAFLLPQQYESTTSMFIPDATAVVSGLVGADLMAEDAAQIAKSRTVLEQVMSSYGLSDSFTYEEFAGLVEAKASEGGRIVTITVTYTDPVSAQKLAKEIRNVTADQITAMTGTGEAYVIDDALLTSEATGPSRILWTIAGVLAGLLLAALVLEILLVKKGGLRIQSSRDVEAFLALPVLAVLPSEEAKRSEALPTEDKGQTEPGKKNPPADAKEEEELPAPDPSEFDDTWDDYDSYEPDNGQEGE